MNLSKLATKPSLIKLTIDDEETLERYGESLDFWVRDRLAMNDYMKFTTINESNISEMFDLVSELVLDESGKPILSEGLSLPIDLMLKVVNMIVEHLGNAMGQSIGKTSSLTK